MLQTFKKLPEIRQVEILTAAAKVFANNGFYQANVDDICKKAGISNGAFYKYFKNKESLFATIFDFVAEGMASKLFIKNLHLEVSIYEKIRAIFEGLIILAKQYPELVMIYVNIGSCEMNKFSKTFAEKIEEEPKKYWLNLVKLGKEHGEIRLDINDSEAAFVIDNQLFMLAYSLVSTYFNTRFRVYFSDREKDVSEKDMINIIVNSMRMLLEK